MRKIFSSKPIFFFGLLVGICFHAHSQTIQYTRQTVPLPTTSDKMQLVVGIAGIHHLLVFTRNKELSLFRFDNELRFLDKKHLPIKSIDSCDTRIIAFKNFYFLYLHNQRSTKHALWKIDANGEAISLSDVFQNIVDTAFAKMSGTLQLVNNHEQLSLVGTTHYDEQKVFATTVMTVNENLGNASSRSFFYPFEKRVDALSQVTLIGENLFILKETRGNESSSLELMKGNVTTGRMFRKTFTSNTLILRGAFAFSAEDSSVLLYSGAARQFSSGKPQEFVCKLDFALKEIVPARLVALRRTDIRGTSFLFVGGDVEQWLSIARSSNVERSLPPKGPTGFTTLAQNATTPVRFRGDGSYNDSLFLKLYNGNPVAGGTYRLADQVDAKGNRIVGVKQIPAPVMFSAVDKDFNLTDDSIVTNEKNPPLLNASAYVNFSTRKKGYLILRQELPHSQNGLAIVSSDDNNQITIRDIGVFEKYEYLLQDAQKLNNETILMPYVQKSEVGLVKLSFENAERK